VVNVNGRCKASGYDYSVYGRGIIMNPGNIRAVTLVLDVGDRFEEVPVASEDVTLALFLDHALKTLEVSLAGQLGEFRRM
jgi:hypothetical protein